MNPVFNGLTYVIWFFATYYIVFFTIMLFSNHADLYETKRMKPGQKPSVSVIVSAYNEEAKIAYTIASLKKVAYDKLEFIIINDGSSDNTAGVVRQHIRGDSRFRFIDRKANKGKAASLNEGISLSKGEFVACIDADSVIEPRMFQKTLPYLLEDPKVGAVTVSVAVTHPKNLLHRIIEIEYIVGLSLFLKVFSTFNCVFVTPGPCSIYRRSMLLEIGGFDEKNITEDLEIAYRIHKAHYRIADCLEAKVKTIVPPSFGDVYRQRRRWYSGALQTVYKHRSMLFSNKYGMYGYFLPFNFGLIFSGLVLFFMTTYLSLKNVFKTLWSYQYTGFNFFDHLFDWHFDIFATRRVSLVGYTAFMAGIAIMFLSLYITKTKAKNKKLGIVGYPFLFFLYQIWWIGAIVAVVRGKKISWR